MYVNLLATNIGATIDIVALIIIALFTILGLKRGFAKSFVSVFGSILSLIFAVLLCSSVCIFLEENYGTVTNTAGRISDFLTRIFGEKLMNTTISQATENMLGEANVGSWLINMVLRYKEDSSIPLNTTLNQLITPTFAYYTVCAFSAILLFIAFRIVFFLIGEIISKLHKVKVIGLTDRVLGLVFGAIQAVSIISFSVFIIKSIPINLFHNVTLAIEETTFTKVLYEKNLFSAILNGMSKTKLNEFIIGFIKR